MHLIDLLADLGHETVSFATDDACGYLGIVAVHSTAAGPAIGGTRLWPYPSAREAIEDALRLSEAMTYKCAVAGIPLGGGKSVIVPRGPGFDREGALLAHGRLIERLEGRYIAGEDVGITPDDMAVMARETAHVAGLPGRSGNPAPSTARGVFRALDTTAHWLWGGGGVAGRHVVVQGCGQVGSRLAALLRDEGARLTVTDVDAERAGAVAAEVGARVVAPDEVLRVEADVLAPCALGGVLTLRSAPELRVQAVVGAANTQVAAPGVAAVLRDRGIVYVPDFVANAGGVLNGCREVCGWTEAEVEAAVDAIADTVLRLLETSSAQRVSPLSAAMELAHERLRAARALSG